MRIFILTLLFFVPVLANADVFISELAWMGTQDSPNNEWIELKNDGNATDITGWTLESIDGTPSIKITATTTIGSGEYFLFERTNDESVPDISADFIYTGALGNTGETLVLKNNLGEVIDEVRGGENWSEVGGDNTTKDTAQIVNGIWGTGTPTPKADNLHLVEEQTQQTPETEQNPPSSSQQSQEQQSIPSSSEEMSEPVVKLIITEIMYDPEGADAKKEWIEIKNMDTKDADLSTWRVFESGTNHKIKPVGNTSLLGPNGFAVISDDSVVFLQDNPNFGGLLFDSSFSLSNSGEELSLKNGDLTEIDSIFYKSDWGASGTGFTLQLVDGVWAEGIATPGMENVHTIFEETGGETANTNAQTDAGDENSYDDAYVGEPNPNSQGETTTPTQNIVDPKTNTTKKNESANSDANSDVVNDNSTVITPTSSLVSYNAGTQTASVIDSNKEGGIFVWLLGLLGLIILGVAGLFINKNTTKAKTGDKIKKLAEEFDYDEE